MDLRTELTFTDVLFEEKMGNGNIGVITLNRPSVLNSLNHAMVLAMQVELAAWAKSDEIKAVVIRAAEGRAFCAGGDLRDKYEDMVAKKGSASDFFKDEYLLNRTIFNYPKPYIALLDGITMGGGVGISLHGSHRVATERLMFAMPETGIGFYPDVGGTYFLPRIVGYLGYYLGLTGARLNCDECVALGITQQKVPADQLPALMEALLQQPFGRDANADVSAVIDRFKTEIAPSELLRQQQDIDAVFSALTMEEIMARAQVSQNEFCKKAYETLLKKSPTSLKVTLAALQREKTMDFDASMQEEFNMTCHFLQSHDFVEGIRAVIIDKDQKPKWKPAELSKVTPEVVAEYFKPV